MKKDDRVAYCFDLIFPEVGELIGGSQREESYEVLEKSMEGMDMEKMQWYLNTRKWGSVPHSGFGLGFERLLMLITKAAKIHDVISRKLLIKINLKKSQLENLTGIFFIYNI